MAVLDDHWPSLPPIRTSSHNSRVSCETLNILTSPPAHPLSSSSTPFFCPPSSSSPPHTPKPASKSANASPPSTASSTTTTTSQFFSYCFPHRLASSKAAISAATNPGKEGNRAGGGGWLLRSMVGFPGGAIPQFSSPVAQFSSTISPSSRSATASAAISPSGRMKPGMSTPHSGMLMRSSKGHAANAFTMMPPDVVGKKKPPDYESDEPTSPEVTCIGRVRRKKPTWDALVKEKQKNDGRKKGKVKKLAAEFPRKTDFIQSVKKNEEDESTMAAKLLKQRSGRRKSHDLEDLQRQLGVDKLHHGQGKLDHGEFSRGICNDGHNVEGLKKQLTMESLDVGFKELGSFHREYVDHHQLSSQTLVDSEWQGENSTSQDENPPSFQPHEALDALSCATAGGDTAASLSQTVPPPNCLLLMRKGSRSRSERCDYEELLEPAAGSVYKHGHTSNDWKWGQVLT